MRWPRSEQERRTVIQLAQLEQKQEQERQIVQLKEGLQIMSQLQAEMQRQYRQKVNLELAQLKFRREMASPQLWVIRIEI